VTQRVSISAPSRLHFGLFSIGDTVARKFGGVGLMIDDPRVVVSAEPSETFSINAEDQKVADAVSQAIRKWFSTFRVFLATELKIDSIQDLPVQLTVNSIPPRHSGLGTGTQLAFASALATTKLLGLPTPNADELSVAVDRGKRSGIGSHGFFRGGLLVDRGKLPSETLAPLDFQSSFPDAWRIVTAIPSLPEGLSGQRELDAFGRLPDSTEADRIEMIELVRKKIIPGVTQTDYDLFANGVFEFGHRSGMMFEQIQNGPYNGSTLEGLVHKLREFGVPATGQSSWGPCVFSVTSNDEQANQLVEFLRTQTEFDCQLNIAKADNVGASQTVGQ
jgi:beta-RFAP synthase